MNTTLSALPHDDLTHEASVYLEQATFGHYIDGEVVESVQGATMPIINPATGREIGAVASATSEDVNRAVTSARASFEDGRWRSLPPTEKEERLRRLANLVDARRELLMDLDALDAGLLRTYCGFVHQLAVDATNYYAGWPTKIRGSVPVTPEGLDVRIVKEPVGVVGLIQPWNAPTAMLVPVVAALAAGNSVVLKPAEQTTMTACVLAQLAVEAGIPAGVFNVLQGEGHVAGHGLVEHRDVDLIGFTGSIETGRRVQSAAGLRVKRVGLELGGKSAQIIFDDADLDRATTAAAAAVWGASGQVCTAGTRVFVQRNVYDEVVNRIVEVSRALELGSPFSSQADMGPLVSAAQLDRVSRYVDIGRQEGAEVVLGGERRGQEGFFFEPTIVTNVNNNMRIAQEEVFGPVMSLLPFETENEVIKLANDVEYGLSAGVWTEGLSRSMRMFRALRVGTVWVNTYQEVMPTVPYGGVKQSGHGRALGAESIDDMMQVKSVWTRTT